MINDENTLDIDVLKQWAQVVKEESTDALPDAKLKEIVSANVAKKAGAIWTNDYVKDLTPDERLNHKFYIETVKPANTKKLASKNKRKCLEITQQIGDAILNIPDATVMVCWEDNPRSITVGINTLISGKTSPEQLSYAGAFNNSPPLTLAGLAEHIRLGHPWMPVQLEPGSTRRQDSANTAECLALDVDGGWSIADCIEHPIIRKFAGLIITTSSHTPEHHKYRIVFKLDRPLTGSANIKSCLTALMGFFPAGVDSACKDSSRFFFGAENAQIITLDDHKVLPASLLELCSTKIQENKTTSLANIKSDSELRVIGEDEDFDNELRRALSYCPIREVGAGTYEDCRNYIWGLCSIVGTDVALGLVEEHDPTRKDWDPKSIIDSYRENSGSGERHFWRIARDYGYLEPIPETGSTTIPFKDDLTKDQYISLSEQYDHCKYTDHHFYPDDLLTKEAMPDPKAGKLKSKDSKNYLDYAHTVNGTLRYNTIGGVFEFGGNVVSLDDAPSLISSSTYVDTSIPKSVSMVMRVAEKNIYNPVMEYLQSIDSTNTDISPDLIKNFPRNFWGNNDPLENKIFHKRLIASVARIYDPGVKDDILPVLHGGVGMFKSTLIKILAGGRKRPNGSFESWFSDQLTMDGNKDNLMIINRAWHHEISEIDGQGSKSSIQHTKKFISTICDTYRAPYSRQTKDHLRSSVLWGTTNESQMLNDAGGDRRFAMIEVAKHIDTEAVSANRDLIWRSALAAYLDGETHHLDADDERDMISKNMAYLMDNGTIDEVILDLVYESVFSYGNGYNGGDMFVTKMDILNQLSRGEKYKALLHSLGSNVDYKISRSLKSIGFNTITKKINGTVKRVWLAGEKTKELVLDILARKTANL